MHQIGNSHVLDRWVYVNLSVCIFLLSPWCTCFVAFFYFLFLLKVILQWSSKKKGLSFRKQQAASGNYGINLENYFHVETKLYFFLNFCVEKLLVKSSESFQYSLFLRGVFLDYSLLLLFLMWVNNSLMLVYILSKNSLGAEKYSVSLESGSC